MANPWRNMTEVEALQRLYQRGFGSDSYSRTQALSPLVQSLIDNAYQDISEPRYDQMLESIRRNPEMESVLNRMFDEAWKQERFDERMRQRGGGRWDTVPGLNFDSKRWIY